ncbi:MAG: hypothetical protein RMJ17_03485 [Candidatus Aenigmarchaeota archaeon]|nr:hypothetical protein [Candidatus Aenigmarchaeota archaeon]MDW8149628.1 hypothetical protein [Candidatus Aenigmarchaeota archaeon]
MIGETIDAGERENKEVIEKKYNEKKSRVGTISRIVETIGDSIRGKDWKEAKKNLEKLRFYGFEIGNLKDVAKNPDLAFYELERKKLEEYIHSLFGSKMELNDTESFQLIQLMENPTDENKEKIAEILSKKGIPEDSMKKYNNVYLKKILSTLKEAYDIASIHVENSKNAIKKEVEKYRKNAIQNLAKKYNIDYSILERLIQDPNNEENKNRLYQTFEKSTNLSLIAPFVHQFRYMKDELNKLEEQRKNIIEAKGRDRRLYRNSIKKYKKDINKLANELNIEEIGSKKLKKNIGGETNENILRIMTNSLIKKLFGQYSPSTLPYDTFKKIDTLLSDTFDDKKIETLAEIIKNYIPTNKYEDYKNFEKSLMKEIEEIKNGEKNIITTAANKFGYNISVDDIEKSSDEIRIQVMNNYIKNKLGNKYSISLPNYITIKNFFKGKVDEKKLYSILKDMGLPIEINMVDELIKKYKLMEGFLKNEEEKIKQNLENYKKKTGPLARITNFIDSSIDKYRKTSDANKGKNNATYNILSYIPKVFTALTYSLYGKPSDAKTK